jgi:hypothetical protein
LIRGEEKGRPRATGGRQLSTRCGAGEVAGVPRAARGCWRSAPSEAAKGAGDLILGWIRQRKDMGWERDGRKRKRVRFGNETQSVRFEYHVTRGKEDECEVHERKKLSKYHLEVEREQN